MRLTFVIFGVAAACTDASAASGTADAWHPLEPGCHPQSLAHTLAHWQDAPKSSPSLRIARAPDSGRGPAVVVMLDRGLNRIFGTGGEPLLLAAVGDRTRTCVTRMALDACAPAQAARERVLKTAFTAGEGFEQPPRLMLHATTYHAQMYDGFGNANALAFGQDSHPLAFAVAEAVDALQVCWQPAMDAWKKGS